MTDLFPADRPVLYLAPMQDVTDLPFLKVIDPYGGADVYVTEYFRVHNDSRPSACRKATDTCGRAAFAVRLMPVQYRPG